MGSRLGCYETVVRVYNRHGIAVLYVAEPVPPYAAINIAARVGGPWALVEQLRAEFPMLTFSPVKSTGGDIQTAIVDYALPEDYAAMYFKLALACGEPTHGDA